MINNTFYLGSFCSIDISHRFLFKYPFIDQKFKYKLMIDTGGNEKMLSKNATNPSPYVCVCVQVRVCVCLCHTLDTSVGRTQRK